MARERWIGRSLLTAIALCCASVVEAQAGPLFTGSMIIPQGVAGSLSVYAIYLSGDGLKNIARGDIDENGNFTVKLPTELSSDHLAPVEPAGFCQGDVGSVTATPGAVPHALAMFVMWLGEESGVIAFLASDVGVFDRFAQEPVTLERGDQILFHLYAEQPFEMSGECTGDDGLVIRFDIDAPAGWSLLDYAFGIEESDKVSVRSIAEMPAGVGWHSQQE